VEKGNAQPRSVKGTFRSLKWWATIVLLGWWHLAPFLRWDRGPGAPDQAILVDLAGRRAYFFFIEIWPQEVYYLTGLLLISAISLFLISALAGRVWCGFLCWQTVYTDIFVLIERLVIGERNQRLALRQAPWSLGKIGKMALVHSAWLAVGGACGISFVLYSGKASHELLLIFTGGATGTTYTVIAVIGGLCYLLAGHARERVCVYVCPYSRFQAAMFDEHSLVVSYEAWRGEPRGHLAAALRALKPTEAFAGRGHCVDCGQCVQVCPTGTDIRRGSQLSCIGCGLCVDACNAVMDHFGLPRGLVSYDCNANQVARSRNGPTGLKLLRPRTVIYGGIIAAVALVMVVSLATRTDVRVDILHDRAPLAVQLAGGRIRNGYDYKVLNMAGEPRVFTLSVSGLPGTTLDVIGGSKGGEEAELAVPRDSVGSFRIFVTRAVAGNAEGNQPLTFILKEKLKEVQVESHSFFALP
jgi:cytochrome c oxidase accessory protein FixG